ncbi:isoprenylcysteine carboxylmethyltransferase family protein [Hyphomonas sp.]|uniref:methyltransferase family protein n=1 Tax=Hyphomonas sp. TaxID=87 RepID=UPI0025C2ABEE|nr:isoprenylcysteine carboxylmethyltransferase family protein [Hyphomonas sp.]MEE2878848.1 isoprenylcysteine carboxylmethyltransferase family protein [Pseudomonadota bacterium]
MNLRIPPVLQLAAFGLAAWAAAKLLPGLSFRIGMVGTVAVVMLATIGAAILLASLGAFRKAATTVNPIHPEAASTLVTGGLYRYTRNPMYLGFAILLTAAAFSFQNYAAALMPALFIISMTILQIKPEERALHARFGPAYEVYRDQTPRWL